MCVFCFAINTRIAFPTVCVEPDKGVNTPSTGTAAVSPR